MISLRATLEISTMARNAVPSGALRKGAWTEDEDLLLKKCIQKYGEGKWHLVPKRAGLNRCRKSCRLRWLNYLSPTITRGKFEEDETDLIIRLHRLLGNRWSLIAGRIPGRTANDIKNYWNTHLQKNQIAEQAKKTEIIRPQPRNFSRNTPLFRGKSTIMKNKTRELPPPRQPTPPPFMPSPPPQGGELLWWDDMLLEETCKSNWDEKEVEENMAGGNCNYSKEIDSHGDWDDIFIDNVDLWEHVELMNTW